MEIFQAERITIYPGRLLVVLNEVEDESPEEGGLLVVDGKGVGVVVALKVSTAPVLWAHGRGPGS